MGNLITLAEYARQRGIPHSTTQQRARRGCYVTAVRLGRDWLIEDDDEPIDHRIKSGAYKDWRAKYGKEGEHDG